MRLLIYLPLTILFILAIMSMLGLGTAQFGELNIDSGKPEETTLYDAYGHAVCNALGIALGEAGSITNARGVAVWQNESRITILPVWFPLFWDDEGNTQVEYVDIGKSGPTQALNNINLSSSLGFIAAIIGLMALATVAGLRILGSGISDVSVGVILLGSVYWGIWGVFSVMGLTLINSMETIGYIFYFMLTLIYTLGIVSSFSNSGEN